MEFLSEIAKQGFLGLLLAGSLTANFFQYKSIIAEKDKRIAEAERVRDTIPAPLAELKQLANNILQIVSRNEKI